MRAKDNMRSGGEVLVDQLVAHGVRHVFCVPGESYLAALDAFHDRDIAMIACRQEGGGATNAAHGIHIARQDSSPLVMFVGQVAREAREREAFQEIDFRAVFGSLTK